MPVRYLDLTHPMVDGMAVYPGDCPPRLRQTAQAAHQGYNAYVLETGMHAGTHVDAPRHFLDGGKTVEDYPPDRFVGRGRLIDARASRPIDEACLDGIELCPGDIALVWTGWSARFGTPAYYRLDDVPYCTEAFAQRLLACGVKVVGFDTPSPDAAPHPVHRLLLGRDVPILENLADLAGLVGARSFEVLAFPLRIGAEGSPIRVVAKIEQ